MYKGKLTNEIKAKHFEKLVDYNALLRENPVLRTLFIEVTQVCNNSCLHCGSRCSVLSSRSKLDGKLTDFEIIECLVDLKSDLEKRGLPLPFITITGGEPTTRHNLAKLMKVIHKMGYKWGMTTNANLMSKEKAQEFKDAGLCSVSVSIDGMENTHNWFRQSENAWEKAVIGVSNLVEVGIPYVMVTTVVHKRNIGELDEIKSLVKSLKADMWRVINVDPIGNALEHPEILLSGKDYKYILDYIKENNAPDFPMLYSCNHYLGLDYEHEVRDWYYACRAGIQVASIQYNGDISACLDIERRPELVFGNIRKDNLLNVWDNKFEIFRKPKANLSEKCRNCEHKDRCDGNGWHTWDYDKNEPKICMLEEISK